MLCRHFIIFILVVWACGSGVTTSPAYQQDNQAAPIWADREELFPTAEYDAPEATDPKELAARRAVSSNYDNWGLVPRNPSPDIQESSVRLEGYPDFPALPVGRSDCVVVGEVLDAAAYLSNNKSGVYSEFHVRVEDVLKGDGLISSATDPVAVVTRVGGFVRYPNGYRRLFDIGGTGMPGVGRRYVLFLARLKQSDGYSIMTGYELKGGKITPMDYSQQFQVFKASGEGEFIEAVRTAVKDEKRDAPR